MLGNSILYSYGKTIGQSIWYSEFERADYLILCNGLLISGIWTFYYCYRIVEFFIRRNLYSMNLIEQEQQSEGFLILIKSGNSGLRSRYSYLRHFGILSPRSPFGYLRSPFGVGMEVRKLSPVGIGVGMEVGD